MMKRNILAVAISALLADILNASEIYNKDGSKLELYGKVDIRHFFGKKSYEDDSRVNLGVKGNAQISDQISGFGRTELAIKSNKNQYEKENTYNLAYAGLKIADFGSFNYGRNYSTLYNINIWTDVLPIYGGDSMSHIDTYISGRNQNILTYSGTDFFGLIDGLNLTLQYQAKNAESNKLSNQDYIKNKGYGFGVAAKYNIGWNIILGGSYTKSNYVLTLTQKVKGCDNNVAEGWNAGIKYDENNLYLAAMYGKTYNMSIFTGIADGNDTKQNCNQTDNIELVSQYFFDEIGLKPSIAYVQSKVKNLINPSNYQNENLTKYVSLGAFYYFNKNLTALIDYKINLVNSSQFAQKYGINSDNLFGLGLVYKF
ncbi:MAG: porin [Arsenophonus sp.]